MLNQKLESDVYEIPDGERTTLGQAISAVIRFRGSANTIEKAAETVEKLGKTDMISDLEFLEHLTEIALQLIRAASKGIFAPDDPEFVEPHRTGFE